MKSNEYLRDALNKKRMNGSEFSRYLGVTRSYISKMLSDERNMDNYTCIQVAEILDVDPMLLINMTNAEREKDLDKKEYFEERVKEYGFVSLSFVLFLNFCGGLFYILC